jgi:hypothetical protein
MLLKATRKKESRKMSQEFNVSAHSAAVEHHPQMGAETAEGSGTVANGQNGAANRWQAMSDKITQLDWRQQVRERPGTISLATFGVGVLLGYGVTSRFKGSRSGSFVSSGDGDQTAADFAEESSADEFSDGEDSSDNTEANYSVTNRGFGSASRRTQSSGPGIYKKFKGTQFFNRLQSEIAKMGDQLIGEVSNVGHHVLLPAVTGKIKSLAGDSNPSQTQPNPHAGDGHSAAAPQSI